MLAVHSPCDTICEPHAGHSSSLDTNQRVDWPIDGPAAIGVNHLSHSAKYSLKRLTQYSNIYINIRGIEDADRTLWKTLCSSHRNHENVVASL